MGIGPGYRSRNPYTHSDASYNAMQESLNNEIKRLKEQIAKNPDPSNYEVLDVYEYGQYTAVKVKYPNCTNMEGIKIMVLRAKLVDLIKFRTLDPHFSDSGLVVARFEPTDLGWELAYRFLRFLLTPQNYIVK